MDKGDSVKPCLHVTFASNVNNGIDGSHLQGSHFSGLTKFPDFSSIFSIFFNVLFFN